MTGMQAGGHSGIEFVIEEVTDLDSAWPEIEPLRASLAEYSSGLRKVPRIEDWRNHLRETYPSGPEAVTLIARSDREAIGFMCCDTVHNHLLYAESFVYIDSAFVLEERRDGGVGKALLERAEAWCAGRGIRQMRTTTDATNALGMAVWPALGFTPSSFNLTKWLEVTS
jgi:GNAT superfamily N-acetyltransferase